MKHKIEITSEGTGRGTQVLLDGENISSGLEAVVFSANVNEPTRVLLQMVGPGVVISEDAEVEELYRCQVVGTLDMPGIDISGKGPTPLEAVRQSLGKLEAALEGWDASDNPG